MRRVLNPLASARLVFESQEIRVVVSQSPTFSPIRDNGRFALQFFAPYPFFRSTQASTVAIGSVKPMFRFPVNYATPHKFGETGDEKYVNVRNDGDVPIPYEKGHALREENGIWRWQGRGDNRGWTGRIIENWFYFEASN